MSDYPPPPGTPRPAGDDRPGPSGGDGNPPPPPPGQGWGAPPPPPPPPPGGPGGYGSGYGGFGGGYGPSGPEGPGGYRVSTAFRYGWDKFTKNVGTLVLITFLILVAVLLVQLVGSAVTNRMSMGGWFGAASLTSLLFSAASLVVQLVIQAGVVKASLGLTRGEPISAGNAFGDIDWLQVLVTSLIIGAMTYVGLILCVLPGIAVVFLTSYALYFVIDRRLPAVEAIKASFRMVAGNFGPLVLLFLLSLAAYVVGACLCGVGLLVAIPVVVIAQAYTFRTLNGDPVTV